MVNKAVLAKEINNTIEYIYPKTSADLVEYTAEQTVEEKLQELTAADTAAGTNLTNNYYNKTETDDLIYVKIDVAAYINIGSSASGTATSVLAELGSSNTVTVHWVCSRIVGSAVPTVLTIDGVSQNVSGSSGSATFSGVNATKTYTVVATDQKTNSATKTVTITFTNKVYWGARASGTINSAFILGLSGSGLQTSRGKTFSVSVASGQYAWYALPASYGTPTFTVGGFTGGFQLAGTVDFTNASGYTASYNVYRSQNAALGTVNVVVS